MSIIVPSSSNLQVFLMSLTDKSPDIWNSADQLKVQSKRRGPLLDSYVWNLHSLGEKIGSLPRHNQNSNSKKMNINDPYWKLIFVDRYSDDQGSNFIVSTDSFNNLAAFSHPVASNLTTKPSITFSPLVHQDFTTSDVIEAHNIIYKCFLFPSYPVLLSTTIQENEHYGPVFPQQLDISVDDRSKSVNISANFLGGRSLFLPPMNLKNLQSTRINSVNNLPSALPYRTANIFDCALEFELFDSFEQFADYAKRKKVFNGRNDFERIVSMNLKVTQNYRSNITANSDQRMIQQGPRYWNLTDRKVTGSITWLSNQYNFYIPTSSSMTLYFGSGFYFPIENVDWQKPIITAVAGQGYLHQFNFVARAVTGAVANGFKSNALGSYVSEFKIPTYLN